MNKKITLTIFSTLLISSSAFADDQQIARGKEIYNGAGACASCHGPLGAGDGPAAAALTPKPANFSAGVFTIDTDGDGKTGTEADLFNVITNGGAKYGKSPMMAGRPDIAEADRKALVQYIISLKK